MPSRSAWVVSGSSLAVRSMRARRSDLVKLKTFFFQPRELRGEFADFGVEFLHLLGMGGVFGRLLLRRLAGEEAREASEGDIAPAVELIGMDIELSGELGDGFLFFEQLADDLGLEGW